jgi:predicted small lipoprotein YifL
MPSRRLTRVTLLSICLCVGAGALTAGCGQKGPLYLPVEEGQQKQEKKTPEAIKAGSPGGSS